MILTRHLGSSHSNLFPEFAHQVRHPREVGLGHDETLTDGIGGVSRLPHIFLVDDPFLMSEEVPTLEENLQFSKIIGGWESVIVALPQFHPPEIGRVVESVPNLHLRPLFLP